MRTHFRLNALSLAVMTTFLSTHAVAQESEQPPAEPVESELASEEDLEDIEIIDVTGFRSSLQKSMNAKRFSDTVSDSIHAEDVGKSTDQNIADALSRVTGVTVQEEAGEGTRISVRGAGPSLNQISINGVALTGGISNDGSDNNATNNNSVDLSSFSSDILSSIDVVKTAAADQDEGSLGANIVLRTVRPLNLKKPRRSFTIEGRYNEFADDNDFRINGSFADKYFDEKLGFIITASRDVQNTRQDRITTDFETGAIPINDLNDGGRTATDLATGQPIRVLGYQRDGQGNVLRDDNGQALVNPIESLVDYDPSTQQLVEGDLFVLARDSINFGLNTDKRERFSLSTGVQYRPDEKTDIQWDVTYTKQDILEDNHSVNMNISPLVLIHPDDDNTALNVVDLRSNTLERSTSRSIGGTTNRTTGLREIETKVSTLDFTRHLTENLTMNIVAGYSQTVDETPDDDEEDRFLSIGTAQWGTATRNAVEAQPDDILELVGYDCSTGSTADCDYFSGSTLAQFDAFDGSVTSVTSRFNPFDLEHNHLGQLVFRKNKMTDTNKSLFLNFDWVLDYEHVRSVEFGAKWADRSRDVNIENTRITNGEDLIDVDDPSAPFEVRGLATIRVADIISGEAFPYDNFGEDLQANRSNPLFGGWPLLDAEKALELVGGKNAGELGVNRSRAGSREIETETMAAYVKTNFEFFDGKLTGNIGVRYVRDESDATGLGSINYIRAPQMLDPYDLIVTRGLANMSNPACPEAIEASGGTRFTPENNDQLRDCWAYSITHGYNFNNQATIPYDTATGQFLIPGADGQVGPDVNRILFVDGSGNIINSNQLPAQIYDQNGNLVPTSASEWARFNTNGLIWPFLDRSTAFTGPNGTGQEVQQREAPVSDSGSNDAWLPSLSLNYALNEETILRFAATKTMTRPSFDSLNPGNNIREQQFGTGNGRAGNTQLKNLTSTNFDFSYEWYFNESGLLSAALFYKDMEDFEETIITPFHYKDVRDQIDLESADLLLDFDPNRTPGDEDNCHPLRYAAGFFDKWTIECDVVNVATVTNGDGATIKGIELGYTQNYTMLPGLLSALGVSVNYTYQDSESEAQEIGSTGRFLRPLPQPFTPKHSANMTIYWEKDGIQLRLANRYTDVQAVSRNNGGAIWQEASSRLDFSGSYAINKNFTVTFNALNLTDETRRNFYTASGTVDATNLSSQEVVLDEGNVFDDSSITTNRTVALFKTGRQFRIGLRGTF